MNPKLFFLFQNFSPIKTASLSIIVATLAQLFHFKFPDWQHQEFIHKLDEFREHHNDDVEDQDEQIMGILEYLTEWLSNHILYVDAQIPQG